MLNWRTRRATDRYRPVAVGGEGPGGTFEEVEAFDPEREEWTALQSLPTPRHGLGVAAIDGDLYAAACGPEPGFSFSNALEILERSPADQTDTSEN